MFQGLSPSPPHIYPYIASLFVLDRWLLSWCATSPITWSCAGQVQVIHWPAYYEGSWEHGACDRSMQNRDRTNEQKAYYWQKWILKTLSKHFLLGCSLRLYVIVQSYDTRQPAPILEWISSYDIYKRVSSLNQNLIHSLSAQRPSEGLSILCQDVHESSVPI
jgi:hypothetical protein